MEVSTLFCNHQLCLQQESLNQFITVCLILANTVKQSMIFAEFLQHPPNERIERKVKIMIRMDRIEELQNKKKWSRRELERQAGIGVGAISKWNVFTPTSKTIKKVADALGCSVAYLTGDSDYISEHDAVIAKWTEQQSAGLADEVRRIEAGIRIPVLGDVPCGIPTEAVEFLDAEDWEEISEKMSRQGKFFALRVKGDSMSPRIEKGDVLIIQQTPDAESGDIVVVRVNGSDACCKRLIKQQEGIVLQSFNPNYSPMYFSNQEIQDKPVQIIGKVVENRQKF